MIYEIIRWSRDLDSDFTLKDCLFGAVKIFLHGNLGGFQKKIIIPLLNQAIPLLQNLLLSMLMPN